VSIIVTRRVGQSIGQLRLGNIGVVPTPNIQPPQPRATGPMQTAKNAAPRNVRYQPALTTAPMRSQPQAAYGSPRIQPRNTRQFVPMQAQSAAVPGNIPSSGTAAESPAGESYLPETPSVMPDLPPVTSYVDTGGETVEERRTPEQAFEASMQEVTSPTITDVDPVATAPRLGGAKVWIPIALAVAGIAGAVWILRRKK